MDEKKKMMGSRERKGVITVYLTITFAVLMSLFVSAYEAARISAYRVMLECAFQSAAFSAFGEYHKELNEQYDLFFIDLSYMTDSPSFENLSARVEDEMNANLGVPETRLLFARSFFGEGFANVRLTDARMASDLLGSVLEKQAVEYVKENSFAGVAEDLVSLVRITEQYELSEEAFEKKREEIKKLEEEPENRERKEKEDFKTKTLSEIGFEYNFVNALDVLILKMDTFEVSGRFLNPLDIPSLRSSVLECDAGNFEEISYDPLQDAYYTEYAVRKCGNYARPKENSFLTYEAEYVFAGLPNDSKNLSVTIRCLFYLRTAAGYASLKQDKDKRQAVENVAAGISALTEIPQKACEEIIYLLWAGGEATYDVRDLLNGEKVSLIKDADDFHLSLEGGLKNLLSVGTGQIENALEDKSRKTGPEETFLGSLTDKEGGIGPDIKLSYEDYLRLLILQTPRQLRNLRMLDVIETDIRQTEGNEYFRIDFCLDAAVFDIHATGGFGIAYEMKRQYFY